MEGDFTLVRQSSGNVGWVALPNLSEAQGEVVSFTAALISYLRGDFEQAETYFSTVRDSKADRLVQNDAALLAGISSFRRKKAIEGLQAAHKQNPYSRFAVQALVMANVSLASDLDAGETRNVYSGQGRQLMSSYRHLFAPDDAWLVAADLALRSLK